MEVLIRPIRHSSDEYAMGHCIYWPSAGTDAISCTLNLNGFTPMTAVLRELGLDSRNFLAEALGGEHVDNGLKVVVHGREKPLVVTATKTERWDSAPNVTAEILNAADAAQCESLCMTHFAFILGKFPEEAFTQCMQQLEQAKNTNNLQKTVVDVDSRYLDLAMAVQQSVKFGRVSIN